jgi:hypothetical protein
MSARTIQYFNDENSSELQHTGNKSALHITPHIHTNQFLHDPSLRHRSLLFVGGGVLHARGLTVAGLIVS